LPMGLRQRFVQKSKQTLLSPSVMRWVTDDRVMKATEGLLDARMRMRAAWHVLLNGHELPAIDPALDPSIAGVETGRSETVETKTNGHSNGNGNGSASVNGNGAAAARASMRGSDDMDESLKERSSLASIGGRDILEKCQKFMAADNARKMGIYPFFRPLDFADGPEAQINGKRVVMFGSNNYLGLTTHPKVREAAKQAIDKYGTSMTGSRLVNGSMRLHEEFEEKLAKWFNKEAALVFTTGYQVNIATLAALLSNKQTVAFIDRNVHASLYDGVRLGQSAGARLVRYRHNDAESLDKALEKLEADEGAFVITDGVFSAEGEIAKLDEIVPVVKKHKARLFVDDAHALGVIGPGGMGTAAHFGLVDQVDLMGGTFSKSMASIGGWLVGERKVLDYIRHFAPSFMFAAAAAPPSVAAAMAAFDVMQEEPWRIEKLRENFTYMREGLKSLGFELGHTQTAVIPIYIRQDLRTIMMWRDLLEDYGIYTNPFISPGVPPKSAMLRTSYMATHERHHLDRALEAFEKVGKKYKVI
ncbi:MAG: aminotransferase class I/II-fold pyridoxal phosphate-dependent enzyme, partial [Myxococcales bacterium]